MARDTLPSLDLGIKKSKGHPKSHSKPVIHHTTHKKPHPVHKKPISVHKRKTIASRTNYPVHKKIIHRVSELKASKLKNFSRPAEKPMKALKTLKPAPTIFRPRSNKDIAMDFAVQ